MHLTSGHTVDGLEQSIMPFAKGMQMPSLDNVVDKLNRHQQPASYGALTVLLGHDPGAHQHVGNLLAERPRDWRHSWVVAAKNGWPTGYTRQQCHPNLKDKPVIKNPYLLQSWYASHP